MGKRYGMIFAAIFALAAILNMFIPTMVGSMVARGMAGLTGSQNVTAEVAKWPTWYMLGGSFDTVRIKARDAKVDKIVFAELDASLTEVELDMAALLKSGQVAIKSVKDIDLAAAITQEELARYLNQNVKGVKNAQVFVESGRVRIVSNFVLGQIASLAITLDGRIVGDGHKIKFVTDRFLLNNTAVGNIGGTVLTEIQLVDLRKLPFAVNARQVTLENGRVSLTADNRTP
jgi:hypothetical protein